MKDEKQALLHLLSNESEQVIALAYAYAKNKIEYGEDITKTWDTAIQQADILNKAYNKGFNEGYAAKCEEREKGECPYYSC